MVITHCEIDRHGFVLDLHDLRGYTVSVGTKEDSSATDGVLLVQRRCVLFKIPLVFKLDFPHNQLDRRAVFILGCFIVFD